MGFQHWNLNTPVFTVISVLILWIFRSEAKSLHTNYLEIRNMLQARTGTNNDNSFWENRWIPNVKSTDNFDTGTSEEGVLPRRLKRAKNFHREKIHPRQAPYLSPYQSIVHLSIGCTGTLVSPQHVLTAAHCVHNGRDIRRGAKMSPLRIGFLRPNGKLHRIRVKKIFVSDKIKPTIRSRFQYDYSILKLVRPHKRPWLRYTSKNEGVRFIDFHTFEKTKKRRSLYKYSLCPVSLLGSKIYLVRHENCPSSPGTSGSAVFSSRSVEPVVIGLVSAGAYFNSTKYGSYNATVLHRFTEGDVKQIKEWIEHRDN